MGLGVSPSQIIGSSSTATSSTTSFESNERMEQMQAEIESLKAQVAEIDSLKAQVAEVDVLKHQIAFLIERVADIKTRAHAMKCLSTMSEAIGHGFIFERLYKIMKEHNNLKVLSN
ncbi:hypothetical protein Fmac_020377 [Flemingia macrophylla]|uniref:Uncharacterized protein n=1 Tax=Flemingia macrophylla TaxID=520843 RepID=A0ABD1LTW9_9FABA